MFKTDQFTFRAHNDECDIFVRRYIPDSEPRAVLQIAHGIVEHSARYNEFASFLAEHGFVVIINDHRGHGGSINSGISRGVFSTSDGWRKVVADLEKLRAMTYEEFPLPYFILGHSMGSFLTRSHMILYPKVEFDGIILSGTGHTPLTVARSASVLSSLIAKSKGHDYPSRFLENLAFGSYNKKVENPQTSFDWLSRDSERVLDYVNDDLCGFCPSVSTFYDLMQGLILIGQQKSYANINKKTPIYMMSGTLDPVGGYSTGVEKVYSMLKNSGVESILCKLYSGARHELLNETNRSEVYNDLLKWLELNI